jgi:hypothetical protein
MDDPCTACGGSWVGVADEFLLGIVVCANCGRRASADGRAVPVPSLHFTRKELADVTIHFDIRKGARPTATFAANNRMAIT